MTEGDLPHLTWLHLSDIHIGHGAAAYKVDQKLVLDSLADDAAALVGSHEVPRPDVIVVTGDIGNTGAGVDPEEYTRARDWLDSLAGRVGVDLTCIVTVPGNHDVNRGIEKVDWRTKRLLQALRDGGHPVDEAFTTPAELEALESRLAGYADFVTGLGGPAARGDLQTHVWSHDYDVAGGFQVRFAGLNTAVLAAGDDDERKLQLGNMQLERMQADGGVAPHRALVVLTHHPLDWLHDAASVTARIASRADVHMSGHVHDAKAGYTHESNGVELCRLVAGAVHGDQEAGFAHHYAFGGIGIAEDGRISVSYWPRIWTPGDNWRVDHQRVPQGSTFAVMEMNRRLAPPAPAGDPPLVNASRALLGETGSRRTAYPLDLPIRDLVESALVIEPTLVGGGDAMSFREIVELVGDSRRSILVLGAPGAGKTMFTHLLHASLLGAGTVIPLPVSLMALLADPADVDAVIASAAGVDRTEIAGAADVVFIVDAVDEALAGGAQPDLVADAFRSLRDRGPVVVTCRTADFERELQRVVDPATFDIVAELGEWTPEQFSQFAHKLGNTDLLDDADGLVEAVMTTPALTSVVERPLFARMLTYVWQAGGSALPTQTALYSAYLQRLAATVEDRLERLGCGGHDVFILWEQLAWRLFVTRGLAGDVVAGDLPTQIVMEAGLTADCAHTVASGLLDHMDVRGEFQARFRHYTFYEFLVAQHVAAQLRARVVDDDGVVDLFENDLPAEIRRHLTRLLAEAEGVPELLHKQFRNLDQLDDPAKMTVGNLVAYYLGRLDTDPAAVRALLDLQDSPFLKTSLYWALANLGDAGSTAEYLETLRDIEGVMAVHNRGYLLYYYGDLNDGPPYLDDVRDRPWTQTRIRTLNVLRRPNYRQDERVTRRAIDVVTSADFFAYRGEVPAADELAVLDGASDDIRDDDAALADLVTFFIERLRR